MNIKEFVMRFFKDYSLEKILTGLISKHIMELDDLSKYSFLTFNDVWAKVSLLKRDEKIAELIGHIPDILSDNYKNFAHFETLIVDGKKRDVFYYLFDLEGKLIKTPIQGQEYIKLYEHELRAIAHAHIITEEFKSFYIVQKMKKSGQRLSVNILIGGSIGAGHGVYRASTEAALKAKRNELNEKLAKGEQLSDSEKALLKGIDEYFTSSLWRDRLYVIAIAVCVVIILGRFL